MAGCYDVSGRVGGESSLDGEAWSGDDGQVALLCV